MEAGARIRELEGQLAAVKAEADAARITTDNLVEDFERRYWAVVDDHKKLQAEHKQQVEELEGLSKDLAASREQGRQLQAQLSARAAELSEATAAAAAASSDHAKLHAALDALRASQAEKCEEVAGLLSANAALRSDKLRLEAELQVAADRAAQLQRSADSQQQRFSRMESTYQQMLSQLEAARDEARAASSSHDVELRALSGQLADAQGELSWLRGSEAAWRRRNEELMKQYTDYVSSVAEQEALQVSASANMQQQLETARASAQVSSEQLGQAQARVSELERLLADSNAALATAQANHEETLRAAQELAAKQAELAEARRLQLETLAAGGAAGSPNAAAAAAAAAAAVAAAAAAGTPRPAAGSSPAGDARAAAAAALVGVVPSQVSSVLAAQGKSYEDVVLMYADMADAFRSEHSSRRHLERQLDALCQQVQRRMAAAAVQAQEHAALLAQQEAAAREVAEAQGHARLLQAQLRELGGQHDDAVSQVGVLRQALADKERQVAVLVAETERLQGRQVQMPTGAVAPTAGRVMGAQEAISVCEGLVTFTSLQELVATNTRLQMVARAVAEQAEKSTEQTAAEYRKRWEAEQAALQAETERLSQMCSRLAAEVEHARAHPGAARHQQLTAAGAGGSGTPPAARSGNAAGGSSSDAGGEQGEQLQLLRQQLADAQQQLEDTASDANNTVGLLRQQLADARNEAAAARAEAAESRAALLVARAQVDNLQLRLGDAQAHEGAAAEMRGRLEVSNARLREELDKARGVAACALQAAHCVACSACSAALCML